MKVFLLLLLLVQFSLEQEWSSPTLLQTGSEIAVAANPETKEILVIRVTAPDLSYSYSSDDGSTWVSGTLNMTGTIPVLGFDRSTGIWLMSYVRNSTLILVRTNEPGSGTWTLVMQTTFSQGRPSLASDQAGSWMVVWLASDGTAMSALSSDNGTTWSYGRFPGPGCPTPILASHGPGNWSMLLNWGSYESFYQGRDQISWPIQKTLSTSSGPSQFSMSISGETILVLLGSGNLTRSNDWGATWSSPEKLTLPRSQVVSGESTWLVVDPNLTSYYSSDEGRSWSSKKITLANSSSIALISTSDDSYLLFYLIVDQIWVVRTLPRVQLVLLNETFLITTPLILNQSLIIEGNLSVGSSLQIRGDLTLLENATLDLSRRTSSIEISGTFTAGGRLVLPEGTGSLVLIEFNSSRGNFSQIVAPKCSQLKYAQSSLILIFDPDCTEPEIQLWMIIMIVVASVITVAIVVVLFIFFRKKIAPYHDRKYHVSSKKQQVT